ncbi:hypothetical protein TSAR_004481 [Trichomalopsis sarcophagae]|uniref:Uncharacterized protein n=1 Tax=Trichomalopsis sarcophagae TaxID=543379 RepID=A0A232FIX6_9HYME|nr:hypothetical protein TSAR_004481 [Trichomalopsis sarcophagae]
MSSLSCESERYLAGPRNKVEPTKDVPKKLPKDSLQDVPRRPLGLTEVLILDTPRVPLQPTSKTKTDKENYQVLRLTTSELPNNLDTVSIRILPYG